MRVTAIIAAGGRGVRFGGHQLKQLASVGGRPLLERSVRAFVAHASIGEVIVALPPELVDEPPACVIGDGSKPVRLVAGGARRQDSVANGFRAAAADSQVIVVHDGARPFVSADLIDRTIGAAVEGGAAVAAVASRDTVKRARRDESGEAIVNETVPRETIFLAQTPQAFQRHVLQAALDFGEQHGVEATDESALAELAGHRVRIVAGEASNIKITTPDDLVLAEAIAASKGLTGRAGKPARTGRAGTGYDLHRLVEGRPLILGGVAIPAARGALGHSDADVICHAVTDAILGAVSLGDIGRHFPDTDPQWKGASSVDLLSRAVAMLTQQGYQVGNVDVTVLLESPKIAPYIPAMCHAVAGAIGIDPARVSIKGKTNEGVDAVGRGEAIAAHAVALVREIGN